MSSSKSPTHREQLEALGTLTAELLHELRQPLFATKGFAQLLRSRSADSDTKRLEDLTGHLLEQVTYMEALVDHYSAFGRPTHNATRFDLDAPVQAAVAMLAEPARQHGVDLQVELHGGGLPFEGREHAIQQVTVNLVKNALDAVRGVDDARVTVRTRKEDEQLVLEVIDSGLGVPAAIRGRVFQPFVSSKPPGDGMGLGLHIVWKLVEEARGKLEMAPVDHGGTRVLVRLPRAV